MAHKQICKPAGTGMHSRVSSYRSSANIVIQRQQFAEGIPYLSCYIDDGLPKPLFLFCHGYTQNKESNMQLLYEMANEGFFVVAADQAGHGDNPAPADDRMYELLQTSTRNIDCLLQHISAIPQADTQHFFLSGASFGGMVTYQYLVQGKQRPTAAAVISSTPDVLAMLERPLGFLSGSMAAGITPIVPPSEQQRAATFAQAEQTTPLNNWQRMQGIPLFIIHGLADPVVPPAGDDKLFALLAPTASDDELQLYQYEGVGHHSTNEMRYKVIDWFVEKRG